MISAPFTIEDLMIWGKLLIKFTAIWDLAKSWNFWIHAPPVLQSPTVHSRNCFWVWLWSNTQFVEFGIIKLESLWITIYLFCTLFPSILRIKRKRMYICTLRSVLHLSKITDYLITYLLVLLSYCRKICFDEKFAQ